MTKAELVKKQGTQRETDGKVKIKMVVSDLVSILKFSPGRVCLQIVGSLCVLMTSTTITEPASCAWAACKTFYTCQSKTV